MLVCDIIFAEEFIIILGAGGRGAQYTLRIFLHLCVHV